jgi:hypothetical protein
MVALRWPKDFRNVQNLSFCYICGVQFENDDETDRDHVPPKNAFHPRDRNPPLILKTHKSCNERFSVVDKKIGQMIALRRGEKPKATRDKALKFVKYPQIGMTGLVNLNIDDAIWRWLAGFHAALYRETMIGARGSIQTPFPKGQTDRGQVVFEPLHPQHAVIVSTIKRNRAHDNLDRLISNNGQLVYECVWAQFDEETRWFCMFGLDFYDWKDLGGHTKEIPSRGCAGYYTLPSYLAPENASRDRAETIITHNYDALDPFAP